MGLELYNTVQCASWGSEAKQSHYKGGNELSKDHPYLMRLCGFSYGIFSLSFPCT